MKRLLTFILPFFATFAVFSCSVPDDITGIAVQSVDIIVGYTSAKVSGTVEFAGSANRIKEINVVYGTTEDNLSQSVKAEFNPQIGFSAELPSLEEGAIYYYNVQIVVGKTPVYGQTNHFITFVDGPVDLDLPSGIMWASHNVGAILPTDAGLFFAWGETEEKGSYAWSNYKWCKSYSGDLTKYVNDWFYAGGNPMDNKDTLDPEDDAATCIMGDSWKTPTLNQWEELKNYCNIEYAVINGTPGQWVYSKSNPLNLKKRIFLSGGQGEYYGANLMTADGYSTYWTSSVNTSLNAQAACFRVANDDPGFFGAWYSSVKDRFRGAQVRAVMIKK